MVSRIFIGMLKPYPDVAALKEYPTMVYHCILFFKDEWFTMGKLVITMILTMMLNHVLVALWLHS